MAGVPEEKQSVPCPLETWNQSTGTSAHGKTHDHDPPQSQRAGKCHTPPVGGTRSHMAKVTDTEGHRGGDNDAVCPRTLLRTPALSRRPQSCGVPRRVTGSAPGVTPWAQGRTCAVKRGHPACLEAGDWGVQMPDPQGLQHQAYQVWHSLPGGVLVCQGEASPHSPSAVDGDPMP